MVYKTLKKEQIEKKYNSYLENNVIDFDNLDDNYRQLREEMVNEYNSLKNLSLSVGKNSRKHFIDMNLGFFLYEYFAKQTDFYPKYESNYDFWRYIAVYVVPDIVADRWGIEKKDHFYSKPTGIYPFQIYWYIKLSWQGSKEETLKILKDNQEDQILQLVDRPSSIGVNLDLYRKIMRKLSTVKKKGKVFRAVMMKNTAKLVNIRPELYDGGIDGYINMLFQMEGVKR